MDLAGRAARHRWPYSEDADQVVAARGGREGLDQCGATAVEVPLPDLDTARADAQLIILSETAPSMCS